MCNKVAFPTKESVKRKLLEIKNINDRVEKKYGRNRRREPIRYYECPDCGGYHLTSKNQ